MRKFITLEKQKNIKFNDSVITFFDSDFIYLPIYDDVIFNINENGNILKNEVLLEGVNDYYSSTLSGKVLNVVEKTINKQKVNCLCIENDFKEKSLKERKKLFEFNKIQKQDLETALGDLHLNTLLNKLNKNSYCNIIINGITDEPYVINEVTYLKVFGSEILDTLDLMSKIYQTENNIVALKNTDNGIINTFLSLGGTYPNINLLLFDDLYLLGRDYFLLEKLKCHNNDTIILKPSEVLQIYNAVKFNKKLDSKYITIVDKNSVSVVDAKLYSSIQELLKAIYPNRNYDKVLINGLMTGFETSSDQEIITLKLESIFLDYKKIPEEKICLNCSKCYLVCPIKINPKLSVLKREKNKNCLDCGLCSYVCPANINLRKFLRGDDHE